MAVNHAAHDPAVTRATAASSYARGLAAHKAERKQTALKLFQEAQKLDKGNPQYLLSVANTLFELGQTSAAVVRFEQLLDMHLTPRLAELAHAGLARCEGGAAYYRSARPVSARAALPRKPPLPNSLRVPAPPPQSAANHLPMTGTIQAPMRHGSTPLDTVKTAQKKRESKAAVLDASKSAFQHARPVSADGRCQQPAGMRFSAGCQGEKERGGMLRDNPKEAPKDALARVAAAAARARKNGTTRDQYEAKLWDTRQRTGQRLNLPR